MKRLRLSVTVAVLLALIALVGAALTGVGPFAGNGAPDAGPTDTPAPTETEIQVTTTQTATGQAQEAGGEFGLLPMWQAGYNGTGTHDYDFDGDGTQEVQQCGNCHMGGGSKHSTPLHPIGLSQTDTGNWFFDDDLQIGPQTRLASQPAGITVKGQSVNCGDCHTPKNAQGFADAAGSGRSSDPHSVHGDVIGREGCIRCHSSGGTMFQGSVTFRQGNATGATNGISSPINMTRVWDGKFLSSPQEAAYNADGTAGSGWNKYTQADADGTVATSCGDCHGQYHAQGALAFTFDDSASSRSGPVALVNDAQSYGIDSGGNKFTCGNCHVTDAHAVHTNGGITARATYPMLTDMDQTITQPGAQGAEYCPECHGQTLASQNGNHFTPEAAEILGLRGPRNAQPDAAGMGVQNGDCGFCHV